MLTAVSGSGKANSLFSSRDQSVARRHPSHTFSGVPPGIDQYTALFSFSYSENAILASDALHIGDRRKDGELIQAVPSRLPDRVSRY